jgi:hypothetical protein
MFEARLTQGKVFKQLIEALKDLERLANLQPERATFASVKSCQI